MEAHPDPLYYGDLQLPHEDDSDTDSTSDIMLRLETLIMERESNCLDVFLNSPQVPTFFISTADCPGWNSV
jgi:hypothetical protein